MKNFEYILIFILTLFLIYIFFFSNRTKKQYNIEQFDSEQNENQSSNQNSTQNQNKSSPDSEIQSQESNFSEIQDESNQSSEILNESEELLTPSENKNITNSETYIDDEFETNLQSSKSTGVKRGGGSGKFQLDSNSPDLSNTNNLGLNNKTGKILYPGKPMAPNEITQAGIGAGVGGQIYEGFQVNNPLQNFEKKIIDIESKKMQKSQDNNDRTQLFNQKSINQMKKNMEKAYKGGYNIGKDCPECGGARDRKNIGGSGIQIANQIIQENPFLETTDFQDRDKIDYRIIPLNKYADNSIDYNYDSEIIEGYQNIAWKPPNYKFF